MASKKIITVLGATGAQGGSVVQTFLSHGADYHVRAVTRNPSSPNAQALAAQGVELVTGDTADLGSLVAAFEGASVIFATTDFWGAVRDPRNQEIAQAENTELLDWAYANEVSHGKNIARAAAQTESLERLVYSGLADVSRWSGGKYTRVYHFDAKAHALNHLRETHPALVAKTSVVQAGWYLENWRDVPFLQPKKNDAGEFEFVVNVPVDLKLPLIATRDDMGPLVKALVDEPRAEKNLIAYREYVSVADMVAVWSEVLKVPAKVNSVILDPSAQPPMFKEITQGYAFWTEFGYEARNDPSVVHPSQLTTKPELGTIRDWISKQDWTHVLQA